MGATSTNFALFLWIVLEFGCRTGNGQSPVAVFDSCGATGRAGPTQAQCQGSYDPSFLEFFPVTVINGIQYITTPFSAVYRFQAFGASGAGENGGKGAFVTGDFPLPEGALIGLLVGQQGEGTSTYGGSGGSFVHRRGESEPMLVAGGGAFGSDASATPEGKDSSDATDSYGTGGRNGSGGVSGAGNSGGGGAGFKADGFGLFSTHSQFGLVPAQPFLLPSSFSTPVSAGSGGFHINESVTCFQGGFGGGGYAFPGAAGGGGGYSGGAGGSSGASAGGGGSFLSGLNSEIVINHTGAGVITFQIIGNGMETFCGPQSFTVVFYRAFVYEASKFLLNDANCTSTSNETHITITSKLNECGTTISFTNETVNFNNVIRNLESSADGTITRHRIGDIPVVCSYPIEDAASISILPELASLDIFLDAADGDFEISLHAYESSEYDIPYTADDFPVEISTNQNIYLELGLGADIGELEMAIDNCFASPSANISEETDIKHVMVDNRCIIDSTLQYLPSPDDVTRRFRFKAFRFAPANFTSIFIHCEVLLCDSADSTSHCKQSCQRTKRSTASDAAVLGPVTTPLEGTVFGTLGPFIVKDDEKDENDEGSSSMQHVYTIIASSVAGAMFLLLVSVVAYVVHAKRVTVVKRGATSTPTFQNEYCVVTE